MITDPIDVEIAAQLRALRKERHMNQSQLGAAAGVTFQQIQKYENGANRVSASRLYKLAKALDTATAGGDAVLETEAAKQAFLLAGVIAAMSYPTPQDEAKACETARTLVAKAEAIAAGASLLCPATRCLSQRCKRSLCQRKLGRIRAGRSRLGRSAPQPRWPSCSSRIPGRCRGRVNAREGAGGGLSGNGRCPNREPRLYGGSKNGHLARAPCQGGFRPMSKQPNATDVLVGIQVRLRRHELGMTQADLAKRLGITFQQVQKYEKGANRISASRLESMSNIMGVPISYFFPEPGVGEGQEAQVEAARGLLETKGLLTGFAGIGSPAVRKAVRGLVEAIEEANYAVLAASNSTNGEAPGIKGVGRLRMFRTCRP